MARGHVGIVVGVQSGFSTLCDLWSRESGKGITQTSLSVEDESGRLHHSMGEITELIKKLIQLKKLCEASGLTTYFALPNSDHLGNLTQFFHFLGEPLKQKEAVRLETIQNLPIKNLVYVGLDVTPSRFIEQMARLTLLCPKVDHIVLSREPKWNHTSLMALKETWKWIHPMQDEEMGNLIKEITGKASLDTGADIRKDPLLTTRSPRMRKLLEMIDRMAADDAPYLIVGEAGAGKELAVKRIHSLSKRASKALVMVEGSDLEVSNFNEALDAKIHEVQDGTLFINGVTELSIENQEALLARIQISEGTRFLLAGTQATEGAIPYSLGTVVVEIPSLKQRKEDLELLVDNFIHKVNFDKKKKVTGISKRALRGLAGYEWPGNVRELEALIERSVVVKVSGMIDVCDFPEKVVSNVISEIEYEDILRGANKRLAPVASSLRKETCYDQKHGEDFKMSNNFFKGHIDQMAGGHGCEGTCQHEHDSSFTGDKNSMQKIEEFLDVLQGAFKCTDDGVDFNTVVDRFENILILAALARTGWNRNRAAALLKLNRTTLVEKLKKKQLGQPGAPAQGVTPTAPVSF